MKMQTEEKSKNEIRKNTVFGERLKYVMLVRDVTNRELANAIFVSPSAVSDYRTGRREPSIDRIVAIADFLDVPIGYLLGVEEWKPAGHLTFIM